MQQGQTQKFLFGGIDSDNAPHAIEPNSLLNSVNVRALLSDDQTSTAIQFINGNEEIQAITSKIGTSAKVLLGKCARDDMFYFFFWDNDPFIASYNARNGVCQILIRNSWVDGGLNWNADLFIDCKSDGELLVFTDGVNDVRYLNLGFDYNAYANPPVLPPSVFLIPQSMITLIQAPPVVPLTAVRADDPSVSSNIQFDALQFCYFVQNDVNFLSVLSPYSLTCLPVRGSEVAVSPTAGNVVDITIDTQQVFTPNWKKISLAVRYPDGNTFFVIKEFNKGIDDPILYNTFRWTGTTLYSLDANYTAKQFDNVPLTAKALNILQSRVELANMKEGYDTPVDIINWTPSISTFTTPINLKSTVNVYLLLSVDTSGKWYYTYFIRADLNGGTNYVNYVIKNKFTTGIATLKPQIIGSATYDTYELDYTLNQLIVSLGKSIHKSKLIATKNQDDPNVLSRTALTSVVENARYNIVQEANDAAFDFVSSAAAHLCLKVNLSNIPLNQLTINVLDDPDEIVSGTDGRCFSPNTNYVTKFQFYDAAQRKCGSSSPYVINISPYASYSRTLSESLSVTINASQPAPSWAKYFSFLLTKQQKSVRTINFIPDFCLFVCERNGDQLYYAPYYELANPISGLVPKYLAIPISSIIKNGYGYTFTEGDFLEFISNTGTSDTSVFRGFIHSVSNGYVNILLPSSIPNDYKYIVSDGSRTIYNRLGTSFEDYAILRPYGIGDGVEYVNQTYVTIYNNVPADDKSYEIAKFGTCANGVIEKFFDTGTLSTTILGDHYTQKRTSNTGAMTGVSDTTYEPKNLFPVNDTGRFCPVDNIGQKQLPTAIRWSNTKIAGTNTNGYASFDGSDLVTVETIAGEIIKLAGSTKGSQEGTLLLILCTLNSYSALMSKEQIVLSNQQSLVAEGKIIATINPLHGKYGCQSPRSVVEWESRVYWVDAYNKKIIEFSHPESIPLGGGGYKGIEVISRKGTVRLFNTILGNLATNSAKSITAGVNPYTREFFVSFPQAKFIPSPILPSIPSLDFDPYDSVTYDNRTYVYNIEQGKWTGSWQSGAEFITDGTVVLGFKDNTVWQEFIGQAGVYYGDNYNALISFPMALGYPVVFSPQSIEINSQSAPAECWVVVGNYDQVAQTAPFVYREGFMRADVLRNRLGNNASTIQEYDAQGISGDRLKGNVVKVAMIWNNNAPITVNEAGMRGRVSSGQMLK